MFNLNIDDLKALVGEACNTVEHPQLTAEQLQELLCAEALTTMARRDLAPDAKDAAVFNQQLAKQLVHSRDKAPARMVDLFKSSMASLAIANNSGDNAQYITAQVKLEMLLGFFNQFAGACARSSFYHYERACAAEGASIDLVRQGNQGSYYAGPRVAIVLPETVEEAMDAIGQFLSTLYNAGIGDCSQWFKGANGALQFGGRADPENDGQWVPFLDYHDMWSDTRAYRMEQQAINAQARSTALGSMLSMLDGIERLEEVGGLELDKPAPQVTVKKSRKAQAAE